MSQFKAWCCYRGHLPCYLYVLTLLLYIWLLRVIQCDIPLVVSGAIVLLPLKCAIITEGQQDLRGNHREPHLRCPAHGLSLKTNVVDLS